MNNGFFAALALAAVVGQVNAQDLKVKPISVTGSGVYGSSYADAFDGNVGSYWNAPGFAPQWIDIDLGRPINLRKIRLLTAQSLGGNTTHEVYVSNTLPSAPGAILTKVWTVGDSVTGTYTADGQWLEREGSADDGSAIGHVRYLRLKTVRSPSWVAWREIEIYQGARISAFYDGVSDGPGVVGDTTALTQAVGANATMVSSMSAPFISSKLAAAQSRGMKVVLTLTGQLFDAMFSASGGFNGNPLRVRSDLSLLTEVAQIAKQYPGVLAAIYMFDEPYTVGLQALGIPYLSDPSNLASAPTPLALAELANIKRELEKAKRLLAESFPGVPVASIATRDRIDMDRPSEYFAMFDWIGYDCYASWGACGGDATATAFSAKLSKPTQRLVAVPKSFLVRGSTVPSPANETPGQAIESIDNWHRLILNDGRYVAAIPFLWNDNVFAQYTLSGANKETLVRNRIAQLQYAILGVPLSASVWEIARDDSPTLARRRILPVSARASSFYQDAIPFKAIDGGTGTSWTSDAKPALGAPQWIEFSFGGSVRLNAIDLMITQSPSGRTEHYLYAGTLSSTGNVDGSRTCITQAQPFAAFTGNTADGQVLSWSGAVDAECVQVKTTVSPSWVGWVEIKFGQNVPASL